MEPALSSRVGTAQAASQLYRAGLEVQALQSHELPSLRRLGSELCSQTSQWWGNGLQMVLLAHLSALGDLDFGLAAGRGLRVASEGTRKEIFRQQVEDVSTCTEITWAHVREFVLAAESREYVDSLTGEFIMHVRAANRRVEAAAGAVAQLQQDLRERQRNVQSDEAALAVQELISKAAAHAAALAAMQSLCVSAREVQRAAYVCADERRAGVAGLNALADILRHGLLSRLQVLLQPGATSIDIDAAIRARDTLARTLKQAMLQVKRLRACRELLLERLEEMGNVAGPEEPLPTSPPAAPGSTHRSHRSHPAT